MRAIKGTEHFRIQDEMPPSLVERMEDLTFRFGQTYDSYLVTEPNRSYFWNRAGNGVVGFVRHGRYLHAVGGLLAPDHAKDSLLADFLEFARLNRKTACLYNVVPEETHLFRRHGCQLTKFGEEPIVDLRETTWQGKACEWVRRQENFCLRQGLSVREIGPDTEPDYRGRVAARLEEVSRLHVANTNHGRELKYFVSEFDALRLGRRRLFVAESATRLEAFVLCNPCLGGRLWAIETYRRRPDAARGVIPFTMLRTMRSLGSEGVEAVSLSLVPCMRCDTPLPGDSVLLRLGSTLWWNRLNWIFDMRGIYHYKSRFRPKFRDMYVAASPKLSFFALRSFFLTWGTLQMGLHRLICSGWRKWRKQSTRCNLANPSLDQPSLDQPSLDQPSLDQPSLDQPSLDQPSLDQPSLAKPEPASRREAGLPLPDPGVLGTGDQPVGMLHLPTSVSAMGQFEPTLDT